MDDHDQIRSLILQRMSLPITDLADVPDGFEPLTIPIPVNLTEEPVIRSILEGVRGCEAIVTSESNQITSWRVMAAN